MSADGLSSVEDLKIVLTAETQKFADGIEASREMIAKFVGDGTGQLGKLDSALGKLGDVVGSMPGKFAALSAQMMVLQQSYETIKDIAEKIGLKDDIADIENAFGTFWNSFQMLAADALAAGGVDVENYRSKLTAAREEADKLAESQPKAMTPIARAVAENIRDIEVATLSHYKTLDTLTWNQLQRLKSMYETQVADVERTGAITIQNVEAFGAAWGQSVEVAVNNLDKLKTKLQELEVERQNRLINSFPKEVGAEMFTDLEKRTEAIRKQNAELEIQQAILGKSAGEAARINEQMRRRNELGSTIIATKDQWEKYDEELQRLISGKQAVEDYAAAKKRMHEQEQEQKRQAKIVEHIDANMESEIEQIRAKIAVQGQSTDALAEELFVEKQLTLARRQGLEVTDADIAGIRARAQEYGALSRVLRQMQDQLTLMKDVNSAVSNDILSEFMNWTRGAEFSVNRMTANILSDLARIAMQRYVLQNLFGGGSTGGSGIFGSIFAGMSGMFGGMFGGGSGGMAVEHVGAGYVNNLPFGGPRAEGGPVDFGNAYLVGERGPEIFVPPSGGQIIPNGALSQMGQQQPGGEIIVRVVASDEFEAKIDSRAQGVVAKAAPDIVGASVKATSKALPGMMQSAQKRAM